MGNHKENPKLKNKWRKKGEGEGHGRVRGFSKCKRIEESKSAYKTWKAYDHRVPNSLKKGKKKLTKEKGNWGKWLGLGFDGCDKYEELEASEDIFSFSNFFLKEKGR